MFLNIKFFLKKDVFKRGKSLMVQWSGVCAFTAAEGEGKRHRKQRKVEIENRTQKEAIRHKSYFYILLSKDSEQLELSKGIKMENSLLNK